MPRVARSLLAADRDEHASRCLGRITDQSIRVQAAQMPQVITHAVRGGLPVDDDALEALPQRIRYKRRITVDQRERRVDGAQSGCFIASTDKYPVPVDAWGRAIERAREAAHQGADGSSEGAGTSHRGIR